MSILLKIVYINDIVIPCFAILCNILLLWLIKTVKTKTLLHINYSLVPNSILDITVSIFGFIVAPHVFHIEGYLYFVFGDLFGSFIGYDIACHIASIFGSLLMTSAISITVSFYVQYLVICRQKIISIRTIIFPCFLLFIALIIFYILLYWFYVTGIYRNPNADIQMLINFWVEEYGRSPIFVANKFVSVAFISLCGFCFSTFIIAYSLIFYYGKQISKTLKTHIDKGNIGTKIVYKQIQRTLFIQAFGPFTIGIVPLLLVLLTFFLKLDSNEISLIISLAFVWLSTSNPVAAFIIIKPYRNYIKTIMLKFILKPFQQHLGRTSKIVPTTK